MRLRAGKSANMTKRAALRAIADSGIGELLVSQAQRRMTRKGDSTHTYPDLWATKVNLGYRAGGNPLQDTGRGRNALSFKREVKTNEVVFTLLDGAGYLVYHQHGFKTKGPNLVPLTRRFLRTHVKGRNPREEVDSAGVGFIEGEDYIMFWNGVDVPQRKVFNLPPEDRAEINQTVGFSMSKARG